MTSKHIFGVALLLAGMVVLMTACALERDGSVAANEMGYHKCTSDADCDGVGICYGYSERKIPNLWGAIDDSNDTPAVVVPPENLPYGYCVIQCGIAEECSTLRAEGDPPLVCHQYRCEACGEDSDCDPLAYGYPAITEMICTEDLTCEAVSVDGDVEAETDGDVEAEADGDVEAEVDGDAEAEADGDVEAEVDGDAEAETDGDVEAETDGDVEAEVDGDVEAETDGDVEVETDGDVEAEADGDVEAEMEAEGEAEAEVAE